MLTKLVLENFMSFKERTEIDFTKVDNYTTLPQNTFEDVLKGSAFVGANASGKSNILVAMKLLLNMLFLDSEQALLKMVSLIGTPEQFESLERYFIIEYYFNIQGNEVKYILNIKFEPEKKREDVIDFKPTLYETLYINNKEILNRKNLNATIHINNEEVSYNSDRVAPTILFLRTLYFNTQFVGNTTLQELMKFLSNSIYVHQVEYNASYSHRKELYFMNYIDKNGVDKINTFFEEYNFNQSISYHRLLEPSTSLIYFHKPNIMKPILFQEESTGNRKLVETLPLFFHAIENNCMLIIDEFSACFHNELERLLIKYFMEKSNKSQLFLATHSTNVLSSAILRPDQLYSVSFQEKGSFVHRFSDDKPRISQSLEGMYNAGVFGGLPIYEDK